MSQSDGIAPQVLLKAGVDPQQAIKAIAAEVERLPKLQYSAEASVSNSTRKLLENAEKEAKQLGDEYLSTEHLLLGALALPGSAGVAALNRLGLTMEKAKAALREIRGKSASDEHEPRSNLSISRKVRS